MTEAVDGSDKVILRLRLGIAHDQFVEHTVVWIGEEHWLDVGIVHTHMLHTILFLITARQFVLLDTTCHVVVRMGTDHESVLGLLIHGLSINIIMFMLVLHQPALILELLEVLCGLLIDFGIIL